MAAVRTLKTTLFLLRFFIMFLSIPPLAFSDGEAGPLLELKESLKNRQALDSSWKEGTEPCDKAAKWIGVVCNKQGLVSGLRLQGLGLSGFFDVDALTELKKLRMIQIENNSFSDKIPEFNKLGALKSLNLRSNQFSGEIPQDFFAQMKSLKRVYLASNKFSGKIPESLTKVPNLLDLHLEYNEFSGPVPLFTQTSITKINVSHNKLEGEIPEGMLKFGKEAFEGNPGLCSPKLGKECPKEKPPKDEDDEDADKAPPPSEASEANEPEGSSTKWVVLGVAGAILAMFLVVKTKRKEENFSVSQKENLDVVVVPVKQSSKRNMSFGKRGDSMRSSSRRGSQKGMATNELIVINEEKGIFGLPDLMKAAAEVLGNGGLGSAYKAAMSNGVTVVVKRMREMNKMSKETFDTEMRRLGKLRHPNILPPLAYNFRKEEKLFVSEYVPKGSLLHLLHGDHGLLHADLNWPTRLKIIKGVAQGMGFLHTEFASYEVPHGNLKASNILLASDYEPLLTDYAFYPLINNTSTVQSLFAYKSPEAILYQQLTHKSDVYCLGIIILEIITGKFPSQYLNNQKGGNDIVQLARSSISEGRERDLIDPEIATAKDSLGKMEKLIHIGVACVESNQDTRINMKEAIRRIEEIQA